MVEFANEILSRPISPHNDLILKNEYGKLLDENAKLKDMESYYKAELEHIKDQLTDIMSENARMKAVLEETECALRNSCLPLDESVFHVYQAITVSLTNNERG